MILTNRKDWEILSSSEIIKHTIKNGFKGIAAFNNLSGDKPYYTLDNKTYIELYPTTGKRLELGEKKNLLKFARLLGDFHNCAQGYSRPPGVRIKTEWGKSIEKYKTMTRRVERFIGIAKERGKVSQFEESVLNKLEPLMWKANNSVEVFKAISYLKVLEKSMLSKEICLNSISDNTAVIGVDGITITEVFELGYNMALQDLGWLIKKGIEVNNPRGIYGDIINEYIKVRPLDEDSINILTAIANFPYRSLKIVNRYIDKKAEEKVLIDKFNKYYEKEQYDFSGDRDGI